MLTGKQRYLQACQKARMISQRQLRQTLAGERDNVECWGDLEQQFIIAELDRLLAVAPPPADVT
jgi:hypothetical protein